MADDFCKFFDAMMERYTLKTDKNETLSSCLNHVEGRSHAHHDIFS